MHIAGILVLWFCWIQVQMLGIDLNFTCTSTWMIDLYSPKPNLWSRSRLLPFNLVWKLSSWLLMFRLVCTGCSSCQYATLFRKLKLFAYNFRVCPCEANKHTCLYANIIQHFVTGFQLAGSEGLWILNTKEDVHSILQSLRCTSKMPKKSLWSRQPVTKQGKAGDSMPALALDWKPL